MPNDTDLPLESQTILPTDLTQAAPPTLQDDEANSPRVEMSPQDVLAKLALGEPIENARIRRIKFRGVFDKPVSFKNCILVQPEFGRVEFQDNVAIVGCTIDRPKFPREMICRKNLGLNGSTINKALIYRLKVEGKFFASGTHFKGKLLFKECDFADYVSFWEANLECWTNFENCTFHADADFRSLHAEQGLVINNCIFEQDILLRGVTIMKKFEANGTRFEGLVDFSKAKLNDFVYLEQIVQGPKQTFAFLNAIGERILVQPNQVEGRLMSEQTGLHEQAMNEYGLLKKCYSAQHRYDQEDWAFYRFKVNQRQSRNPRWTRPWTYWRTFGEWLFLDVGCGYGTNPVRAVRMAFVIIFGFGLLYAFGVEQFYAEKKPFPDYELTDWPNRAMIGLTTSVSVFTSGMGGIREIAKGWMNVPVMLESVMGTLLFGLFIVAFSRKVIR